MSGWCNDPHLEIDRALRRKLALTVLGICVFAFPNWAGRAAAQPALPRQSLEVSIDQVDDALLVRLDDYVAAAQWDNALDVIDVLINRSNGTWLPVTEAEEQSPRFRTYLPTSEFAQSYLANGPVELLSRYRDRHQALVEQLMDVPQPDRHAANRRMLRSLLMAGAGEDILLGLAARELERGHYHVARGYLERLRSGFRLQADDQPRSPSYLDGPLWLHEWSASTADDPFSSRWTSGDSAAFFSSSVLPDATISTADIWARLTWISVLEHNWERAEKELQHLRYWFPEARGKLMAAEGLWSELLEQELQREKESPSDRPGQWDWQSFAGTVARNGVAAGGRIDPAGQPLWTRSLPRVNAGDDQTLVSQGRLMESAERALAYFPVVVGDKIYWCEQDRIRAFRLDNGEPLFPAAEKETSPEFGTLWELTDSITESSRRLTIGVPRLTVSGTKESLFARLGSSYTGSHDPSLRRPAWIVGLDLRREARLMPGFPLAARLDKGTLSGTPIRHGDRLYVVKRQNSPDSERTKLSVCAYELSAVAVDQALQLVWETKVVEADAPNFGEWNEITHDLLSFDEGILFLNSNLGVVTAIDSEDGFPLWMTQYPRQSLYTPAGQRHYQRDLNPCLVSQGQVIVAPSDTPELFALDRNNGRLIWSQHVPDALYLLGASDRWITVGGPSLIWLDRSSGVAVTQFPRPTMPSFASAARSSPRGYGRGTIGQDCIYWPTHDAVFVFALNPLKTLGADGRDWHVPQGLAKIDLRMRGIHGGNLLIAGEYLVVSGTEQLSVFRDPAMVTDE